MFILSLLMDIVWGAAAVGGGLFLYGDYRRGFPFVKSISGSVYERAKALIGKKDSDLERAEKALGEYNKSVALVRESVSSIKASAQLAEKQAKENRLLAGEFRRAEEEALLAGADQEAEIAAHAKIQAELRANMFEQYAQEQYAAYAALEQERRVGEMEADSIQTQVDTIRTNVEISNGRRQTYNLLSGINTQFGFTPGGEIERILLKTEHEKLLTANLIDIARERGGKKRLLALRESSEVRKELEDARSKLRLLTDGSGTNLSGEQVMGTKEGSAPFIEVKAEGDYG